MYTILGFIWLIHGSRVCTVLHGAVVDRHRHISVPHHVPHCSATPPTGRTHTFPPTESRHRAGSPGAARNEPRSHALAPAAFRPDWVPAGTATAAGPTAGLGPTMGTACATGGDPRPAKVKARTLRQQPRS